jgi:predicted  nucleic acid-binding Zn-ribbon protein
MSDDYRTPSDDPEGKETKPTISTVFRLLQDVETRLNARIEGTEERLVARIEGTEERLIARIEGTEERLNARIDKTDARLDQVEARLAKDMAEGFKDLGHKINALNRRALQTEADYEDLSERVGRLESKAS